MSESSLNKLIKVLITGGNGFLGRKCVQLLANDSALSLRVAVRNDQMAHNISAEFVSVGDIHGCTDWSNALKDIDVVIHTAGRAHIMKDSSLDPLTEFRCVNVEGTSNLLRHCLKSGVKRFVFISSIKVNGEITTNRTPFSYADKPNPMDDYAISKYEAEEKVKEITKGTNLEYVLLRPPLIYGKGHKGNMASLAALVQKKIPLPFGMLKNKRDLVSVSNLVDLIKVCLTNENAKNKTFLVSDNNPLTIPQLINHIKANKIKTKLLYIPVPLLKLMLLIIGKKNIVDRLFESMLVDVSHTMHILDWEPPYSVEDELGKILS